MKPIRNHWIFQMYLCAVTLFVSGAPLTWAQNAPESVPRSMDMVWIDMVGGQHNIMYSAWKEGAWSEPLRVTNDTLDNLAPCIDTGKDGKKHLVWMAVDATGHRVKHAVLDQSRWSEPDVIPTLPAVSGAPFVTIDDNGVVWVVFAGNDGEDDDIYCTRLINGVWTVYQRVNADNDAPDIHPFIEITTQNQVVITWQGYRDNGYVTLQSVWENGAWQAGTVVQDGVKTEKDFSGVREAAKAGVVLPAFVGDTSQVFLRGNDN